MVRYEDWTGNEGTLKDLQKAGGGFFVKKFDCLEAKQREMRGCLRLLHNCVQHRNQAWLGMHLW